MHATEIVRDLRKFFPKRMTEAQRIDYMLLSLRLDDEMRPQYQKNVLEEIRKLKVRKKTRDAAKYISDLASVYEALGLPIDDQVDLCKEAADLLKASGDDIQWDQMILRVADLEKQRHHFEVAASITKNHLALRSKVMERSAIESFVLLNAEMRCFLDAGDGCDRVIAESSNLLRDFGVSPNGSHSYANLSILDARNQRLKGDIFGALERLRVVELMMTGSSEDVVAKARILIAAWSAESGQFDVAAQMFAIVRQVMEGTRVFSSELRLEFVEEYISYLIMEKQFSAADDFLESPFVKNISAEGRVFGHRILMCRTLIDYANGQISKVQASLGEFEKIGPKNLDIGLQGRYFYLNGILGQNSSSNLDDLKRSLQMTHPERLSLRDEIFAAIWKNLGAIGLNPKRCLFLSALSDQRVLEFLDSEMKDIRSANTLSNDALLAAHPLRGVILLALFDGKNCISDEQVGVDGKVNLPQDMVTKISDMKRLRIIADGGRGRIDPGSFLIGGDRLKDRVALSYGFNGKNRIAKTKLTNGIPRTAGVIVSLDSAHLIAKSGKIISRFFPGSHLYDPREFTAKAFERMIEEHDVVVFSAPKSGGPWSWNPSNYLLGGVQSSRELKFDRTQNFKKSSHPFIAVLPQINQSLDVIRVLENLGAAAVITNRGAEDKEADVFYTKNLLKLIKTNDVCEAVRLASVRTLKYYPKQNPDFRIYGECVGFN
jgi:hypothetical protein